MLNSVVENINFSEIVCSIVENDIINKYDINIKLVEFDDNQIISVIINKIYTTDNITKNLSIWVY